jgi:intracellular sulfur oxidation DsrE/DsrF family protein
MHTLSLKQTGFMALLLLTLGFAAAPAVQAADKEGVVIQVSDNDPAKWNLALNNAKNIQKDFGKDKVNIEIVAYGPGINMLKKDSAVGSRLDEITLSGVTVSACQNTMKGQNLSEKDMHPSIGYVPSGVVEIMKKQKAGSAYLRP